jgi:hypothetical protein
MGDKFLFDRRQEWLNEPFQFLIPNVPGRDQEQFFGPAGEDVRVDEIGILGDDDPTLRFGYA